MSVSDNFKRVKLLILLICLSPGIVALVIPNLNAIAGAYPGVSDSTIVMLSTLPYLTALPTTLFCATLCRRFGERAVTLASLLCMLVGGVGPMFVHDITIILVFRAIFGLGWGPSMTVPFSLAGEYLPPAEQATFIGIATAVVSPGSTVFSLVGGFMGQNLTLLWASHALLLAVLVPCMLLFPKEASASGAADAMDVAESGDGKVSLPSAFFVLIVFVLLMAGVIVSGLNLTSFIVDAKGVGGSELSGIIISVSQAASFVGGMITGVVVGKLGRRSALVCYVAAALGYVLFARATSVPALMVASVVFGLFTSICSALAFVHIAWVVPAKDNDVATSITSTANMAASFFVAYLPAIVASGLGRADDYEFQFIVIAVVLALVGIGHFVLFSTGRTKESVDAALAAVDGEG